MEEAHTAVRGYLVPANASAGLGDPATFWDTLHTAATLLGELPATHAEPMLNIREYVLAALPNGQRGKGVTVIIHPPPDVHVHAWLSDHDIRVFRSNLNKRRLRDPQKDRIYEQCCRFIMDQLDKLHYGDHLLLLTTRSPEVTNTFGADP